MTTIFDEIIFEIDCLGNQEYYGLLTETHPDRMNELLRKLRDIYQNNKGTPDENKAKYLSLYLTGYMNAKNHTIHPDNIISFDDC